MMGRRLVTRMIKVVSEGLMKDILFVSLFFCVWLGYVPWPWKAQAR